MSLYKSKKPVGKKISLEKSHIKKKNISVQYMLRSEGWENVRLMPAKPWQPPCCQPMQTRCGLSWFSPVKLNWITLQLQRAICACAVTTEQLQMRACLHLSITVLSTAKATSVLSQLACCAHCSALATLLLPSLAGSSLLSECYTAVPQSLHLLIWQPYFIWSYHSVTGVEDRALSPFWRWE